MIVVVSVHAYNIGAVKYDWKILYVVAKFVFLIRLVFFFVFFVGFHLNTEKSNMTGRSASSLQSFFSFLDLIYFTQMNQYIYHIRHCKVCRERIQIVANAILIAYDEEADVNVPKPNFEKCILVCLI